MKNHLYSLIMLFLLVFDVSIQKAIAQQSDDYYTIRDAWMGYFNAHPQLITDTNEDGEYQEFM